MPLHLDSIMNDKQKNDVFTWVIQECMDGCDSLFISEDKKYFHIRNNIIDKLTNKPIGKFIYTLMLGDNVLEIKDIDIVWDCDTTTILKFNVLRDGSSDANEYYSVEVVEDGQHLEIETVNRHVINGSIVGTEREVFACAFPFELNVYDNMDDFNSWAGFESPVQVGGTDITVGGFSPKFTMPGRIFGDEKNSGESYSFMLGEVVSFRNVEVTFGENTCQFILADVDTALGVIPVGMSEDVFDLEKLKLGSVIAMNADIKVDLAQDKDFRYNCK